MADRPKKRTSPGTRNENRKNGKAWKQGKAPDVREAEASVKRAAKKQAKKAAEVFAVDREKS